MIEEQPHHAACRGRTEDEHRALWDADTAALEDYDLGEYLFMPVDSPAPARVDEE